MFPKHTLSLDACTTFNSIDNFPFMYPKNGASLTIQVHKKCLKSKNHSLFNLAKPLFVS